MSEINGKADSAEDTFGMSTLAIHRSDLDSWSWKPTILPIYTSSNYKYDTLDVERHGTESYFYVRCGNPTRNHVEKTLAKLEGGQFGFCFSSGLAAAVAVLHLLQPSDHIICADAVYGGITHYLNKYVKTRGFEVTYVDSNDPENFSKAVKPNTKLVWLEVLCNPTLRLLNIQTVADSLSNRPDIIITVDNTFLTPCLYKPLNHGATIVMHSLTKYMNGHGDVLMGSLATNNSEIAKTLQCVQESLGIVPPPFDCYMINRSLKTLKIRMQEHGNNALKIAQFLVAHPFVENVVYPGLKNHPQHELAKTMLNGFGGMLSFHLKGTKENTDLFLKKLKIIVFSASLGMTESIMCYPWSTSHGMLSPEEKQAIGITETFVRLSVGLEDPADIIQDLDQALTAAEKPLGQKQQ